MAAFARCRLCGFRIERSVSFVYADGAELKLEESQERELMGRLAEHVQARHPREFRADPAAVEALRRWRGNHATEQRGGIREEEEKAR